MMFIRLHCCTRTSTLALLFPSSFAAMSTLSFVKGSASLSNINLNTAQRSGAETISLPRKIANQGSSPLVSEHQRGGIVQNDQLLEPVLEQDDELLHNTGFTRILEEHCLPTSFGKKNSFKYRNLRSIHHSVEHKKSKYRKRHTTLKPFDICQYETEVTETSDSVSEDFAFQRSSREVDDNTEELEVNELIVEPTQSLLRPGMVLLKKYISPEEQVSIVKKCRELGLGQGGFYHPGYKDGAKLRLRMMCLGLDWDPQTRKYQKQRQIDKAKPPDIPSEFRLLVNKAMEDSLSLVRETFNVSNAEKIFPRMTADICIVNFYTETGRLGLHQDRDESEESLSKGLPVVSFSVGDTAEFLYSDDRDANKAKKLVLESGDVLIFGGESRHIFHGISSIIPYSAPAFLHEQTMLRHGRLNLTFRQY